mmetsp:Transcript_9504/g.39844  ORF Transcript_9504/g.39844 Transcript_9504/m.39844 type:complete len:269 (-) Transcript_9504:457-1263(-)
MFLRPRVLNIWNGKILFVSRQNATASASITTDFVPAAKYLGNDRITSGNLGVLSSWLREKIFTLPSGKRWICARSPSYLYSHVNCTSWNRWSTSRTPLVGFASMGFTGTPGRKWHLSASLSTPPSISSAGTISSNDGHSENTCLSTSNAAPNASATATSPPFSFNSAAFFECSTTACASAHVTVCCAKPILSFPCNDRTMYPASHSRAPTRSFLIFDFLASTLLFPSVVAMARNSFSTPAIVNFGGENMVFCVLLDSIATIPKSPSFL